MSYINDQLIQQVFDVKQKCSKSWHDARQQKKTKIEYDKFGIAGGDGFESWQNRQLRFGDQLATMAYSYGIEWSNLQRKFPQIFSLEYHYNDVKGNDWPSFENLSSNNLSEVSPRTLDEIFDTTRWNWHKLSEWQNDWLVGQYNGSYCPSINVFDQVKFVMQQKTRIPKAVLEIGGGRGEIANVFAYLGVPCTSIEPGDYAKFLYHVTGKYFFGESFDTVSPLVVDLRRLSNDVDLSMFDTIIFCQSIEHVQESDFWIFWSKVCKEFHGIFIVTNWMNYHPIPFALPEHIFEINDYVYDRLVGDSDACVFRNGSHLILDIKKKS